MIEKFLGMMFGYWAAKFLDSMFGAGVPMVGPPAGAAVVKEGERPATVPAGAIPSVSPGAIPVKYEAAPNGLPPFPSGWAFKKPTDAIVQRAWGLLPLLSMGQVKYETAPGDPNLWLAYRKEPHAGGKTGVTVYTPKRGEVVPARGAPASGARVLKLQTPMMKGADVLAWQRKLNTLGISPLVSEDGTFGPKLDKATKAFQSSRGLSADGKVGPNTWSAANAVAS